MKEFISKHVGLFFLALMIPLLYAIGYSYDLGYMSRYGLDIQLFKGDIDYYLINAFVAFTHVLLSIFPYFDKWDIVLFCAALAVIFYLILWSIQFNVEGKIISWQNNLIRSTHSKFLFISISISTVFIALLFAFFMSLFALISLPVMSYVQGKDDAKKEISNYQSCDKMNAKLKGCALITQDGKEIASGRIIEHSENYVAIFDGAQTKVIPIGSKQIDIIMK